MKPIEAGIIKELKKGDHDSFRRVFDRYSKPLFRFSLQYLKSEEASEDLVQEVFLKIWNNRRELKTDTSFQSYLFTIALNAVRKHFNRLSSTHEMKHELLLELNTRGENLDDRNDYQELLYKLDELIGNMPEKRRLVFVKKKLEGKSLKDIAEELMIDPKTVEYHITEAMKFLKQEFTSLQVKGLIFFCLFIGQ